MAFRASVTTCASRLGATVNHSTGTTSVLSVQVAGGLTLSGGTLTLTDTAAGNESTVATFTHSSGTLDGAATLVVTGTATWSNATSSQSGLGTTRIASGATLTTGGLGAGPLSQRTLDVEGSMVLGTNFSLAGGATVDIGIGGVVTVQTDGTITRNADAPVERILNAGTVQKTGGIGVSRLDPEVVNSGTIRATTGFLELAGGDGTGAQTGGFDGTGTGLVRFLTGAFDFAAGSSLKGQTQLAGATLNIVAGASVPVALGARFTHTSGTVTGPGTLDVLGIFVWQAGEHSGTGTTRVAPGAVLTRPALGTTVTLTARTLGIEGEATFGAAASSWRRAPRSTSTPERRSTSRATSSSRVTLTPLSSASSTPARSRRRPARERPPSIPSSRTPASSRPARERSSPRRSPTTRRPPTRSPAGRTSPRRRSRSPTPTSS